MNKRQRKKRAKKKLTNWLIGVDLSSGRDMTVCFPSTVLHHIYSNIEIEKQYIAWHKYNVEPVSQAIMINLAKEGADCQTEET